MGVSAATNERAEAPAANGRAGKLLVLVLVLLAGVAARGIALQAAPRNSYLPDHLDYMAWAAYIHHHGLTSAYEMPAGVAIRMVAPEASGRFSESLIQAPHACNYPPLGVYVFWLQGALWRGLDSSVLVPQANGSSMAAPVANTMTARFVNALPSLIADVLLAFGAAGLVRRVRGRAHWQAAELAAFALAFLAPPVWLDSAFWNQADAWIACELVWTVAFLMDRRFVPAGAAYGLALMTKPQAILLGPVILFYFVLLAVGRETRGGLFVAVLRFVIATTVAAGLVALPFILHDARSGASAFRWFENSYRETLNAKSYQRVTLNAFNIWMLDLARQPAPRTADELNLQLTNQASVAGLSKALWGKALLVGAVLLAWALAFRRRSQPHEALLICATLVTFSAFMLPTGVHERYIYYCVPFLMALACIRPRWLIALIPLLVVATTEMISFQFVRLGDPASRGPAAAWAALALAAFIACWALAGIRSTRPVETIVRPAE